MHCSDYATLGLEWMQLELWTYSTRNGVEPFRIWYESLARDRRAFDAVTQRLSRLRAGNFGDYKSLGRTRVGPRVLELRVNLGPGYRIYCAKVSTTVVLLLGGGSKRRQRRDIEIAQQRMLDFGARSHGKKK
jgi:putative addiction module killer protein